VISCINLATILDDRIDRAIGRLSAEAMSKIDECLAVALGIEGPRA
jgi:mRNA-degrading endonuclease toxin of MazEF toxin-antitoxin module